MKIAVIGLWHLGCVTAACLAKAGHDVVGYDNNAEIIQQLKIGKAPLFEPGLDGLILTMQQQRKLKFNMDANHITDADIVWVTFDTPVDQDDRADTLWVEAEIKKLFPYLKNDGVMIISSQLPVGTIDKLHKEFTHCLPKNKITLVCIPENLRLGKSIAVFSHPDRIIVGLDDLEKKSEIQTLLKPISENIVWMSVVSAEMTKHAINSFLAVSVTFINELAAICETVGANAKDVEAGLKTEERIGPKAYLRPGGAIAGGTLMRDVNYLEEIGKNKHRETCLLSSVIKSNHYHKQWSCRKLLDVLKNINGKTIAMLGLTYKADTDTLRRSSAIETCEWLAKEGVVIHAYDPGIACLPPQLAQFISIKHTVADALKTADAVIISTEHPQFQELTANDFCQSSIKQIVLDPSGFVAKKLMNDSRIQYFSVGVPS